MNFKMKKNRMYLSNIKICLIDFKISNIQARENVAMNI